MTCLVVHKEMKYKSIFFDLDGTVTEPVMGITNAIIYALEKYNIKVKDRSQLHKFIGPPLRKSFQEFYGFTEDEAEQAVSYYREYYSDKGLRENEVMPGMEEALKTLNQAGFKLYIATSKPEHFAVSILKNLNLYQYFDIAAGSTMDKTRDSKELVIEYLLNRINIKKDSEQIKEIVMVGDRKFDIEGANCFSMDSIGVLFGYGDREEFETAGATYIVNDANELVDIIMNQE